jgi:hypothetical protein
MPPSYFSFVVAVDGQTTENGLTIKLLSVDLLLLSFILHHDGLGCQNFLFMFLYLNYL